LDQAEAAIRHGRVRVNGQCPREPLFRVRDADQVAFDGRSVSLSARTRVVMFHKPAGCVTSHHGDAGRPTVFDLLARVLPSDLASYGWHAIGRLDVNTTGLLLFTNDEELVAHVTSPGTKLAKRYVATVQGAPTASALSPLTVGIPLGGDLAHAVAARVRGPGVVELLLTEGKFHQVKRMLGAVGFPVRALHREAVGELGLDVPEGQARVLTDSEVTRGLGYVARLFHAGADRRR
jgi:23S rRNA pseudouridine2605 synthase